MRRASRLLPRGERPEALSVFGESVVERMLSLGESQRLFVGLLGRLIEYTYKQPGWEFSLAEGYIGDSINKPGEDTPHKRHGAHFNRLGIDLNLFIYGKLVSDGAALEWLELGVFWEELHPLCFWGGRLDNVDSNHFSLRYRGVA